MQQRPNRVPTNPKSNRWITILFILSFVLFSPFHPKSDAQGPPPAKVVIEKVMRDAVSETRSVTGVLYYERVSDLSTEVAGLVKTVTVNQGDRVKKGDSLVHLDTELLEKDIALTRTRIAQYDLRIENKEKNYNRLKRLFNKSVSSEKEFDDALFAYQDAQKEKQAAQDTLSKLMIQKKRAVILSPFDGIVLTKNVDTGAWVQQGKVLMQIGSQSDLFVRAPIAEELLRFIRVGETLQVHITAFDREMSGTLVGIDPVADLKTKNVFLKIKVPSMEMVAENMSVTVFVPGSEKRELSLFNRAALVKFQGSNFIYTVKEDKASLVPVNVVAYVGNRVATADPHITPDMVVVIEGNERLRPDQAVIVANP